LLSYRLDPRFLSRCVRTIIALQFSSPG